MYVCIMFQHNSETPGVISTKLGTHDYIYIYIYYIYFNQTWYTYAYICIFCIYIKMNVCMFVRYALLNHSSDCDETSVSCCAQAREGF
jgi:hypothetical protein